MQKPLLTVVFIAITLVLSAQGTFIPLQTDAYTYINRLDIKYDKILPVEFTADKGYERGKVAKIAETLLLSNLKFNSVEQFQLKYLVDENAEWLDSLHSRSKPFLRKLYTEPASFYSVNSKKKGLFDLRLNPILGISIGGESGGGGRFQFYKSVGVEVRGNIKQVFSFYFNATGNDERAPSYVDQAIVAPGFTYATGAFYKFQYVPGEAYYKVYHSGLFHFNDGIDYFDARGYVKANILKFMNLTFGRDKFFIGDGDRSLILSDFSAPYLFLKFDVSFWRFKYENIYAQLTGDYNRGSDTMLPIKYMALHHLTLDAAPWLTIGIFEEVVFERSEFDFSYLNPIIFYKSVEAALGDPDKISVGGDFKANFAHHCSFYGQFLLNEFNASDFFSGNGWWANKWALQLGFKYIDIAPNLDGQIEVNVVRPFTYTADGTDNFTNYDQPLGDPYGANFYEMIFNLHYQPLRKVSFNAKYMLAKVGTDTLINDVMANYGGNILLPNGGGSLPYIVHQYGNKFLQGAPGTVNYFEFLTTYQPWHNINLDCSMTYRSFSTVKSPNNPLTSQNTFIFNVGIRLNIARRTYQF